MKVIFCIDIGGTKTAAAFFSPEGKELFYRQMPTLPEEGAESLLARLQAETASFRAGKEIIAACLACPGPLDVAKGTIVRAATMQWRDVPIVAMLNDLFGCTFRLLNDCSAGALGAWSVRKPDNMLYVSVSTGVGGGLVLHGKLYEGRGNAAEIGHVQVPGNGAKCACGGVDCLELYSSGSGISRLYAEQTGEKLSAKEIAQKAREGDGFAKGLFTQAGRKLNAVLKNVDTLLDLDEIVIGGGLLHAADLFWKEAVAGLDKCRKAASDGKQVLQGAYLYSLA